MISSYGSAKNIDGPQVPNELVTSLGGDDSEHH